MGTRMTAEFNLNLFECVNCDLIRVSRERYDHRTERKEMASRMDKEGGGVGCMGCMLHKAIYNAPWAIAPFYT